MNILHHVSKAQLSGVVGEELADKICAARAGTLHLQAGGGGIYGKVVQE